MKKIMRCLDRSLLLHLNRPNNYFFTKTIFARITVIDKKK